MPEVAVVILNYNGKKFLEQFLPSVVSYSQPHRVIVADNASTDDSVEFLRTSFPNVELIINESNGGFAKGYNDALSKVDAPFYLLLNSDVEVTPNWIEPLLEAMKDPKVAACQPKVRSFHDREKFEHAGAAGGFVDKYYFPFCRGRMFDSVETDTGQYDFPTTVFWTSGACMLIRASVYNQAGGLDERFFAHMEEIDLCWRLQRMGYTLSFTPGSTVYHVGGGTLNYQSPRKTYLNFRNSLLMIQKNHRKGVFWLLFRRLSMDGAAALQFLAKGQFAYFWAVLKSHVLFYLMMPSSFRERRRWKHLEGKKLQGRYHGSILFAYFARKVKVFSALNQRLMEK